ncbi:MAG: O-antigen ligase family protein [Desulfobacterales bacterium]|nr:O-antigen ligase family protein [Desulfobacterales bacterium]
MLNFIKIGIYASFVSFLIIFPNWFFPYVTSKQIYFNVLIEVLTFVWIVFLLRYPQYKPKFSFISLGLGIFFAAIFISCFTGTDFILSFWGDAERMLGWFHIIHFLIYYFIIITVFRDYRDWQKLFIVYLSISCLIFLYGFGQKFGLLFSTGGGRIDSTLGNPTYVGTIAVFNIFLSFLLFFKENKNYRFIYLFFTCIAFTGLILSGTRGALLGVITGLISTGFIYAFLSNNRIIKKTTMISLVVVLIGTAGLLTFNLIQYESLKDTTKHNETEITIGERLFLLASSPMSIKVRLIAWEAVFKNLRSHPLLGVGWGNFSNIWDKHFNPEYYLYESERPFLDRAHNIFLEILSTTGILGLVSYLLISGFVFFYLISAYRKSYIELSDFIWLTGLMIAYYVQNITLFDTLVSYVSLMIILAYIHWIYSNDNDKLIEKNKSSNNLFVIVLISFIAALASLWVIFQHNIKPALVFSKTIESFDILNSNDIVGSVKKFEEVSNYKSPLDRYPKTIFLQTIEKKSNLLSNLPDKQRNEVLNFIIKQGESNVENNPLDTRMQLMLARTFQLGFKSSKEKADRKFYLNKVLQTFDNTISTSPKRVYTYFEKANLYVLNNQTDKAIELISYGISLNPKFPDGYYYLLNLYAIKGDIKEAIKFAEKIIEMNPSKKVEITNFIKKLKLKFPNYQTKNLDFN